MSYPIVKSDWKCPALTHVKSLSLTVISFMLMITACSTNSYMGISVSPGRSDFKIQQLAILARNGDKSAQLELGVAFEEGRIVKKDIAKARELYRLAASDSGGPLWVYFPSAGHGTAGHVALVEVAQKRQGLGEAKKRLQAMLEKSNDK
jgi:TPR repeat protein